MSLWQVGMAGGFLMVAAGLTLLGFLAFWRQAPPIDGRPEPSWLQDSGERPYVGQRRMPAAPPRVQDLTSVDETDGTWSWRASEPDTWPPAPPRHRWEHLEERTRPLRPPQPPVE